MTATQEINEAVYHVTQLIRMGGALALEVVRGDGKKFLFSFPNGPDVPMTKSMLLRRMRSGLDNLEVILDK